MFFQGWYIESNMFLCVQYSLYTMMVFDEWHNGIPCAFIVIGKNQEPDLDLVLWTLMECMLMDWLPNPIIVDNAQAEINVLRFVLCYFSTMTLFICYLNQLKKSNSPLSIAKHRLFIYSLIILILMLKCYAHYSPSDNKTVKYSCRTKPFVGMSECCSI